MHGYAVMADTILSWIQASVPVTLISWINVMLNVHYILVK